MSWYAYIKSFLPSSLEDSKKICVLNLSDKCEAVEQCAKINQTRSFSGTVTSVNETNGMIDTKVNVGLILIAIMYAYLSDKRYCLFKVCPTVQFFF